MSVDIEQIDPRNGPALRAWWEVGHAATAERPGSPWPAWEHSSRTLPAANPERTLVLLAAIDDREMVGAALFTAPVQDNRHAATLGAYVRPDRRREGIGSALVTELEALASGHGRAILLGEAYAPLGGTSAAEAFAGVLGFEIAGREAIRELSLTDYDVRRPDCIAEVGGLAADYSLVTFDTVGPEQHVDSSGGSLGGHLLTALAIASDGAVAGLSEVRVNDAEPTHGEVGVTLGRPRDLGHRLGMALKMASHDLARTMYPDLLSLRTSHAEVNAHMNAVNDALGYRTIETLLELQKKLG